MRKMQYNSFSKYEKISDSLLEKHINSKLNRTLTSSVVLRLDNEEIKNLYYFLHYSKLITNFAP